MQEENNVIEIGKKEAENGSSSMKLTTPKIGLKELESIKNLIYETLDSYGVAVDKIIATVNPGDTLFEFVPMPGASISSIIELKEDIEFRLATLSACFLGPMPGKSTIGIQIPNEKIV